MKAFSCPDCGASIKAADFSTATIECPYCNSSVIVPEELRPAPPALPTPPTPRRRRDITQSPYFTGGMVFFIICAAIGITFVIILRIVPSHDQKSTAHPTRRLGIAVAKANILTPAVALTFGNSGMGNGAFQNAHGIALDAGGNLYVSDETLRIQKFSPAGKFVSTLTLPATMRGDDTENGPNKLFADGTGQVYAVSGGAVGKFDGASGKRLGTIGGSDYFEDAVLTPDGGFTLISWKNKKSNLVYLDSNGDELKRLPGFLLKNIEGDTAIMAGALRLASDGRGNIFVLYALGTYNGSKHYDPNAIAVYKFTSDGNYVGSFGLEGHGPDQLETPTAIAIDNQNRVYVSEVAGDIKVFDTEGNYLMTLKTPHSAQAMAFDKDNNLYIVGASKVSKLVLNN
jgi:DNA-directed RNA polymerase subunit RPC12/RpoP